MKAGDKVKIEVRRFNVWEYLGIGTYLGKEKGCVILHWGHLLPQVFHRAEYKGRVITSPDARFRKA